MDKDLIVALVNLLYKIDMDEKDKKLLFKSFKKNKKFLESLKMTKKEFDDELICSYVSDALALI